jgi:hypothetical protein
MLQQVLHAKRWALSGNSITELNQRLEYSQDRFFERVGIREWRALSISYRRHWAHINMRLDTFLQRALSPEVNILFLQA